MRIKWCLGITLLGLACCLGCSRPPTTGSEANTSNSPMKAVPKELASPDAVQSPGFAIETRTDQGPIPKEMQSASTGSSTEPALPTQPATPAKADPAASDNGVIVPGQGIMGVKLGALRSEAEAILGSPNTTDLQGGSIEDVAVYAKYGLIVNYEKGRVSSLQVTRLGDIKPFAGRTQEGIGLGSSREELLQAYGKPDLDSPTTIMYNSTMTVYSLQNGVVSSIFLNNNQ